ncbi:PhoP/PhoQ regulator MgrB [Sodalis ligni]
MLWLSALNSFCDQGGDFSTVCVLSRNGCHGDGCHGRLPSCFCP